MLVLRWFNVEGIPFAPVLTQITDLVCAHVIFAKTSPQRTGPYFVDSTCTHSINWGSR